MKITTGPARDRRVLLEPATAALIAVAFLGEPLTPGLLAGSALLLAAIAALARESG
ncbi:hypothetical protein J5Y04_14940 [Kitasatospora sp. RG8]|uniref:hypothetical protein n=1 Tax=Kitasatospora sp. RG8 TaxID=2820815 RepID=UPI001ADFC845|nr:hypothetical protein [Kitasatospora sp. RG8]MBP0450832.1 hypothetical protein [Kitasatospora sp. RG8]